MSALLFWCLAVAERYVDAFANIAKAGNTIVVPAARGNPGSVIVCAMSIFQGGKKA